MTITDIFNRALGLIGHDRTITEGETTSTEYVRCDREWDGARLAVLTAHDWNWLVSETPLMEGAECEADTSDMVEYQYDRPDDIIRLISVLDGYNHAVAYRAANGVIMSKEPELKFRYLADTEIPDDWPSCIVDAIAFELASRIALAMTANGKVVQAMKQLAIGYLSQAISIDASEMRLSGSDGTKYSASRR